MQPALKDYGVNIKKTSLYRDRTTVIAITKNPVLHSQTKYIAVKYYFIREHVQNESIDIQYVSTKQ